MTQAFNLAQLANNLNTSGQLDATDGLFGVLPRSNGGTGSSATAYCSLTSNVSGILPVANGGTGASSAAGALANLGALAGSTSQLVKAWVNFDGNTGGIRASYNVSSINFFSTGNYAINFSTGLGDANYAVVSGVGTLISDGVQGAARLGNVNSSGFELGVVNQPGNFFVNNGVVTAIAIR
jgi:hypothetical protein